jgi:hypothetical protein
LDRKNWRTGRREKGEGRREKGEGRREKRLGGFGGGGAGEGAGRFGSVQDELGMMCILQSFMAVEDAA